MLDKEYLNLAKFLSNNNIYTLESINNYNIVIIYLSIRDIDNNLITIVATRIISTFLLIKF